MPAPAPVDEPSVTAFSAPHAKDLSSMRPGVEVVAASPITPSSFRKYWSAALAAGTTASVAAMVVVAAKVISREKRMPRVCAPAVVVAIPRISGYFLHRL